MRNNKALIQVFLAMALAVVAGALSRDIPYLLAGYDLVGKLFLQGLTLVIVPLVAASVITGTARMAQDAAIASLGTRTVFYFALTTALAVASALFVAYIFVPYFPQLSAMLPDAGQSTAAIVQSAPKGWWGAIEQLALKMLPNNILGAAATGQMLGLIIFCILFGWFISKIEKGAATVLFAFWQGVFLVMMCITKLIMRAMPLGVFALIAKVVATTGFSALQPLLLFSCSVVAALLLFAAAVLPALLGICRINPLALLRAVAPALVTAFSTSSTAATMPMLLECIEKRTVLPSRVTSFVLPLAASVNLPGTALYQTMAVLFIAKVYGVELPIASWTMVGVMAFVTSFGIAGIPSASLVSIVVILQMLGLPAEGIALIMAVERLLDMARTTVNVWSNGSCAALVAAAAAATKVGDGQAPAALQEQVI